MAFLQILFLSFVLLLCHTNLCVSAGLTIITPVQNQTDADSSFRPIVGSPAKVIVSSASAAPRALPGNIPDDLSVFSNGRKAILNVLQCLFQKDNRAQCFFDRAQRALDEQRSKLLAQADAEVDRYYSLKTGGRAKSEDKPTSVSHSVTQIITELTDMLSDSFGTFFNAKDTTGTKDVNTITDELDEDDDDDDDDNEETDANDAAEEDANSDLAERTSKAVSRKKKKKGKIHKLIALIKLLVTGAVLKAILDTVLNLVSTHLQKKFFFIAIVGLLLNLARFWFDAKKLHHPQKVIYYEHAQHQHHYEHPEESHHGSGSFWGRSFDIKPLPFDTPPSTQDIHKTHNIVYNAHIPL